MTTMPVTLQERIPLAVNAPGAPAPAGAAVTPGDVIRILKQRIFLILFIWFGITALTVAATYWADKNYSLYRAQSIVLVEPPSKGPMEFEEQMLQVDLMDRLVQDQIVRVTSETVLTEALKSMEVIQTRWYQDGKLKAGNDVGPLLDELKDELSVQQVPRTNYMVVSFKTRAREDAPKIVNAVIDKYRTDLEATAKSTVQREWESYRNKTAEKYNYLRGRRDEKKNFVAMQFSTPGVTSGMNVAGETFRSLNDAVTQLEAEKLAFKAQYENLRGVTSDQIALSPQLRQLIQQDPQVFQLSSQLVNLQQEREIRLRRVGQQHREVKQIDDAVQAIESALAELQLAKENEILEYQVKSAEQAYLNATQAELQLRERLSSQQAVQHDIDQKLAEYQNMEEEVKMLEEEYSQLQMFTNQLALMQAAENPGRVRQIGTAQIPRQKYFPRWEINLPAGSMLGLMLGVGLAMLLELIDTSIKTSRDIPRHVHVPILGTIPDVDDEEVQIEQVELAARTAPRSMVAEAFRTIRTNLLLSSPAERQRTVLVASSRPEEGRTTVAINLALSIAQNGRRVLLVDANFHRPAVQRFFPNTQGGGLSNVLIGQKTLAEVAVPTDLPNLDILPSGPIPPNPTELLAGPYLQKMIAEAQDRYDQIIFDGPPVLLVSDGLVLAGAVDGVILVCRAKTTSRGVALRGREQLERVNGRLFGAVLNAAQVARGGYFREQIRSYYEYQPEESLTATAMPVLPQEVSPDSETSQDSRPEA
jgi:capsular exopolysaccharide synthesis family protein